MKPYIASVYYEETKRPTGGYDLDVIIPARILTKSERGSDKPEDILEHLHLYDISVQAIDPYLYAKATQIHFLNKKINDKTEQDIQQIVGELVENPYHALQLNMQDTTETNGKEYAISQKQQYIGKDKAILEKYGLGQLRNLNVLVHQSEDTKLFGINYRFYTEDFDTFEGSSLGIVEVAQNEGLTEIEANTIMEHLTSEQYDPKPIIEQLLNAHYYYAITNLPETGE